MFPSLPIPESRGNGKVDLKAEFSRFITHSFGFSFDDFFEGLNDLEPAVDEGGCFTG